MTSTLRISLNNVLVGSIFLLLLIPLAAFAQPAVSLSISPTLFEISANPEQSWTSTVRVINSNPFEIRIFTDVVNFTPQDESGQGKFVPVFSEETQGQTMAEWIAVSDSEIIIPAEQTAQIPFTVTVPSDAPPGGHYAALLIGTRSENGTDGQLNVETSQVVSSLLFLRVSGDIIEQGGIREFVTENSIYESPTVKFDLRFENKGNVHLQPQGEIKILNMWGQERGIIPVNQRSLFGKVLPEQIRKYTFTWTGEWSLADIGRYSAVATLAYGEEGRQFATETTHFWVIPWKVLGTIVLMLLAFVWLFTWAIKLYVRKMLLLAGVSPELQSAKPAHSRVRRKVSVVAPIEAGMLDLRNRLQKTHGVESLLKEITSFINVYRWFFIVIIAIVTLVVLLYLFIASASVSERGYEITIDGVSGEVQITSEDARYNELIKNQEVPTVVDSKPFPAIELINRSGVTGLAGELQFELEVNGYSVSNVENEFGVSESRTVIVYSPQYAEEALELSKFIGETLLSSYVEDSELDYPISIYIGSDLENTVE